MSRCAIWLSSFIHLIVTLARLLGPGGMRSVVAESVLVKHQLLILNRSRARSPNLRTSDRLVAGLCALCIRPARLIRSAIVLKPSTLLSLHHALENREYRLLFSSKRRGKPGPKGPSNELIKAVVEMKDRTLFWTGADLENKLLDFRTYFNHHRTHTSREGRTPDQDTRRPRPVADLNCYRWRSHCRGLYHTPMAA